MTCRECDRKVHARGLCMNHYAIWYRAHRAEASAQRTHITRHWKFTAETWWSWWEKRTPDRRTLELRAGIKALRYGLP